MNSLIEKVIVFIGIIGLIVIIAIILAFPIKWLWNWLMPVIFSLPKITVWQSLGLIILSGLLLKSTNSNNPVN